MDRLNQDAFSRIEHLTGGLRDQGMALAVLAGLRPGLVVVDDRSQPTSILIAAPEGAFAWIYLAGDSENAAFCAELNGWLFDQQGLGREVVFAFIACDSSAWEASLLEIVSPRAVIPDRRLRYECEALVSPRDFAVPEGYTIFPVDRPLLDSDVSIPDKITEWMVANFGSAGAFLEHGLGSVAVHERRIVAWSLADSLVGGLSDLGVETEEAHRRRGLGAAVTRRSVELAFERGATRVGWHCHAINVPSIRTAEKAGLRLQYEYPIYPIQFDSERHAELTSVIAAEYTEAGLAALAARDYAEADLLFDRLLGFAPDLDADVHASAARAAAAVGDTDRAFGFLERAVERGQRAVERAMTQSELEPLKTDPRWETLVDRLLDN